MKNVKIIVLFLFLTSTLIGQVSLTKPADGFVTNNTSVSFEWNIAQNIQYYELLMASNVNFTNPTLTTYTDAQCSLTLPAGRYYWKVRVKNSDGSFTNWSPYRMFDIIDFSTIGTLSAWFTAGNSVVVDGSNRVSQWGDVNGVYNLTQATSTLQPLLQANSLNGYPSVYFDGTRQIGNSNSLTIGTFFTVLKHQNNSSTNYIATGLSAATANPRFGISFNGFSINTTTSTLFNATELQVLNAGSTTVPANTWKIISGKKTSTATTMANFQMSPTHSAYSRLTGNIAEQISFSTLLSTANLSLVNSYLRHKYFPPVNLGRDVVVSYGFAPVVLSTQPYSTYSWSTAQTTQSISVSESGNYSVSVVDDLGYTTSDTVSVQFPTINFPANTTICQGQSITWNTNLTGSYTYLWNNGATTASLSISSPGTYFVTVTDINGFFKTFPSRSFTVDDFPNQISLGQDVSTCSGNSIALTQGANLVVGYQWSTNQTTSSIQVTTTGNYSVTVVNSNGCSASDEIHVDIQGESPIIQYSFPTTVCVNAPFTYTDNSTVNGSNISGVHWVFGDNTTSDLSTGTKQYVSAGNYTVNLTVSSVSGCSNTQAFQVSVKPNPQANFTVPSFCTGFPVTLTNTSSTSIGGGAITANNWSVNNQSVGSSSDLTYTFPTNGSYDVTLTISDANGCSGTTTTSVSSTNNYPVPASPSLMSPFSGATITNGTGTLFEWTAQANISNYQFELSSTADFSSIVYQTSVTSSTINYTPTAIGNYYWRVKSQNLCQLGGTSEVRQIQVIGINSGLSLWLRADAGTTALSGALSQWSDQSGNGNHTTQSSASLRPTIQTSTQFGSKPVIRFDGSDDVLTGTTIPNLNTDNLTVLIVSSGQTQTGTLGGLFAVGPTSSGFSVSRSITTNTQAFRVWANNTTQLTSAANSAPTSGYTPKLLTVNREVNVQGKMFVNGVLQATTTNAAFLSSFTNTAFQIGKMPSYQTLNGDIAEVLVYNRVLSSNEQTEVEKYLMDKYAPPVNLGADINNSYGFCDLTLAPITGYYTNYLWSNSATTSSITVNNPGTYWLQVTDVFGRLSYDTIVVNRPHYASINLNNQLVCFNNLPTITASMPSGDYTFSNWSDGVLTQTRTLNADGNLSYVVKDNQNCVLSSNTAVITFDASLQNTTFGGDTTLCAGNSIQLLNSLPTNTIYQWSTNQTTSSIQVTSTGNYSVTVVNSNGCSASDEIHVDIQGESPIIQYSFPTTVCVDAPFTYVDNSTVNGSSISGVHWVFGDNTTSDLSTGTKQYVSAGNYAVSLTVSSISGCSNTQTFQVSVKPNPQANFTIPSFCTGFPVTLTNTSSTLIGGGAITANSWSVNNQSVGSSSDLTYTFPTNGSYDVTLTISDANGCSGTTTTSVSSTNNYPVPASPSLMSPFSGATITNGTGTLFEWTAQANTSNYQFELSSTADFSSIVYQTSVTSSTINYTPTAIGNYYWRVKSQNLCQLGGTSEVRQIQVIGINTGLSLWLRADAGTTAVSGAISQWSDQSGNGNHTTQSSASLRPTIQTSAQFGSKPVIRFDGSDDVLTGTTIPNLNTENLTVLIVSSGQSQTGTLGGLFAVGPTSSGFSVSRSITTNAQAFRVWANNTTQLTSAANSAPTSGYTPKLLTVNREVNVQGKMFLNGVLQATTTNTAFLSSFTNTAFQIGKMPSYQTLNGDIAEVLVYNRVLSSNEQTEIEKYLMDKYAPPVNLGADITSNYGFCDTILQTSGYYSTYNWSTGATTPTISVNRPGTYWLQATDVFGRISRDSIQIIRPVYDSIRMNDRVVCYNNLEYFTPQLPYGQYYFDHWSDGSTDPNRFLYDNEVISYTLRDNRNCTFTTNTASITIDHSLEGISLGVDTSLCVGNSISLVSSDSSIIYYMWNTGNNQAVQFLDTSGEYILDVYNANGCTNRDSVNISIIGYAPTLVYTIPTTFCQFAPLSVVESSFVPNGGTINQVQWYVDSVLVSSNTNLNTLFSTVGTHEIRLDVTAANTCRSIGVNQILVNPKPSVSFTTQFACPYQQMLFTPSNAVNVSISQYAWNFGQPSSGASNTNQSVNPFHGYGTAGMYNVELKVVDANGCKDTTLQTIEVIPAPIADFSVTSGCQGQEITLIDNSSIAGTNTISTKVWNYGDGTSATNPTSPKIYSELGTYSISLVTIGSNGCVDTTENSVTINAIPVLDWQLSASCKGVATSFESLSTIPVGSIDSTAWLVNLQYPFEGTSGAYTFATTGVQYLNLHTVSDLGCAKDTLIIVNVNPEIKVDFNYSPSNVVAGVPIQFSNLSTGATEFEWDLGDGSQVLNSENISYTYNSGAAGYQVWVTLKGENDLGCRDSIIKSFILDTADLDLQVSQLFFQEMNGYNKIGVELKNKGSITIDKANVNLTNQDNLNIQETWQGELLPGASQIYMFNASVASYISSQDEIDAYYCVEGEVINNQLTELKTENNSICYNLEGDGAVFLSLYPNPTETEAALSLLIAATEENPVALTIQLYAENGTLIQTIADGISVLNGVHTYPINLSNVSRGLYFCKVSDGTKSKTLRLIRW